MDRVASGGRGPMPGWMDITIRTAVRRRHARARGAGALWFPTADGGIMATGA